MGDAGVDVSGYNNVLDWSAVRRAGTVWGWAKASEATSYVNGRFGQQMAGGRAAGLRMGAYHFGDPRYSTAVQVQHFVDIAGQQQAFSDGSLLPLLDMENEPGVFSWQSSQANTYIRAFRDLLRQATGQAKLCVYASQNWWATGFLQPDQWVDDDIYLCAARYGVTAGNVGWSHRRLAVHQYTDASQPYGLDRSVTVGGYTLDQLTIKKKEEEQKMCFWFIGNIDTGEVALLLPNAEFHSVAGSNYSAVIEANNVPKLDVPQGVWTDLAGVAGNARQDLVNRLVAAGVGVGGAGGAVETVKLALAGSGTWSLDSDAPTGKA